MKTFEEIHQKLRNYFKSGEVELYNTSSKHIGHNNSGMHLKTIIYYSGFEGKSTLDRHRMVHTALKEEIGKEIHAITIETYTNKNAWASWSPNCNQPLWTKIN